MIAIDLEKMLGFEESPPDDSPMADPKRIKAAHWKLLVHRISRGECVPFLGAAVNVGCGGYAGLPLGAEVARTLLSDLTDLQEKDFFKTEPEYHAKLREYSLLTRKGVEDLARVALHLGAVNDKKYLVDRLEEILPDEDRQPSEILEVVASLPCRLIVTTNYDRLLEKCVAARDKGPKHSRPYYKLVVQPAPDSVDEKYWINLDKELVDWKVGQKKSPSEYGPVIYKIHGSFASPEGDLGGDLPPTVVVTEEDYIAFLSTLRQSIPHQIRSWMTTSTFLFLGYSLEDWDFRSLFHTFRTELRRRWEDDIRSIAIQKSPSGFWVDFWERKGVTIYDMDLYEFVEQLSDKYQVYRKKLETKAAST